MRKPSVTVKTIGHRRRAYVRYDLIISRLTKTHLPKNKKYAGVKLLVTRDEFIPWFQERDFEGASVDRIDNNGHYELGNMQVISLAENIRKDKLIAKDGISKCSDCAKWMDLSELRRDDSRCVGIKNICIPCSRERNRINNIAYRARKREQVSL